MPLLPYLTSVHSKLLKMFSKKLETAGFGSFPLLEHTVPGSHFIQSLETCLVSSHLGFVRTKSNIKPKRHQIK